MSIIGNPIGQAGFVSAPVTRVEDAPIWQLARPRGGERVRHPPRPRTDAEIAAQDAYETHAVARAGAARRGEVRHVGSDEVNARAIAASRPAAQPPGAVHDTAALVALTAAVERLQATVDAQAEVLQAIQARVDTLEGNDFTDGDAS